MNVGSTENQLWREEAQGGVRQAGPQSGLSIFIFKAQSQSSGVCPTSKKSTAGFLDEGSKVTYYHLVWSEFLVSANASHNVEHPDVKVPEKPAAAAKFAPPPPSETRRSEP